MRAVILTFAGLMVVSALMFFGAGGDASLGWSLPPIPADILAWIVVNQPDANLELLSQVKLEAVSLEPADLGAAPPLALTRLRQAALLGQARIWILVHGLEKREEGARKIHLSLLLSRDEARDARLDEAVQQLAEALFEGPAKVMEDGEVRVLAGTSPQQLLYQVRLPDVLVVSNSESGWRQVVEAWAGKRPLMSQTSAFQKLDRHFNLTQGILVYCDTKQIVPFLPEFGYQIRRRTWGIEEEFFPIPPDQEVKNAGTAE